MSQTTQSLEIWAIIELFGHTQIAGKVTEQVVAGASMVRVDVPELEDQPAFTRFLNPSAVYAINPVTEEVAVFRAKQIKVKPISQWDIREMNQKLLALGVVNPTSDSDNSQDEEEDDTDDEGHW